METSYFHAPENRLVPVLLPQVHKSRVAMEELDSGKRWTIPACMFNLQGEVPDLAPRQRGKVDRLTLQVGDRVGFTDNNGRELMGKVIKLNPKRAKIATAEGIWNVYYESLFPVIEGERDQGVLLPRE